MTPEQKVDLLRAACCVSGIDGKTTAEERKLIDRLAKDVGVGQASVAAMIARGESDPDFYKLQFRILHDDPQETIVTLIHVAMADGHVDEREVEVLRGIANNLEIPGDVFDQVMARAASMTHNSGGEASSQNGA